MQAVDAIDQDIIGFIGGSRTPQQQVVSYLANAFSMPHVGGIVSMLLIIIIIFSPLLSLPHCCSFLSLFVFHY